MKANSLATLNISRTSGAHVQSLIPLVKPNILQELFADLLPSVDVVKAIGAGPLPPALPVGLRVLHLVDCVTLSDTSMTYIASSLTNLTDLAICAYHIPFLSVALLILYVIIASKTTQDASVRSLEKLAPQLRRLTMKGFSTSDAAFGPVLENLSVVEALSLRACMGVTDSSLGRFCPTNTSLRQLNLAGCTQIAGASLAALSMRLTALRELDLSFTRPQQAHTVMFIASQRNLSILRIADCATLNADVALIDILKDLRWCGSSVRASVQKLHN
jgi:hypothetical protein